MEKINEKDKTFKRGKKTKASKKKKKRFKIKKPKGIVFVQSTTNNTIVTLTDLKGNTKHWASAGSCGFKGARRKTHYAAQIVAEKVAKDARHSGLRIVKVEIKGIFAKKKSAVKGLYSSGLKIVRIKDNTNIPHNGCRLPKKKRK